VIGHIKKRPVIAAILAAIFAATPATFFAQTEETATASTPDAAAEAGVYVEQRLNEFRRQYLDDRAEFRNQYLDDRADSINSWLTVIALFLGIFALLVPAAGYFGYRKFLSGVEDEARKSLEKIKAHEEQAEKAVKILRQTTSKDVADDPAKAEQVKKAVETVRLTPEASLIDKAIALAHSLQKAGETEKAIEQWRSIAHLMEGVDNRIAQAIRLNPKYSAAYYNRGNAKVGLEQHEAAIQDYNEAIHLNPKYSDAYYNRGLAKAHLQQYEAAIQDCNEAIRLNPEDSAAYCNRGLAKASMQQYEAAIQDFNEAIRLNPKYSVAYYNRGLAKPQLGRIDEARSDLQTALRLAKEEGNEKLVATIIDALHALRQIDHPETK